MQFPSDHPLAAAPLPFWSPEVRERLAEFDVLLVAGMKLMQQYIYHEPARPIPEHVRLVQIDDDPWELGKNYPLEVGVVGHPKPALAELASLLAAQMTPEQAAAARGRAAAPRPVARASDGRPCGARRKAASTSGRMAPLEPDGKPGPGLARRRGGDRRVATTTMGCYFERVGVLKNTDGYFAQRGWALGWGLNCAIGVKLAWPDRPVLGDHRRRLGDVRHPGPLDRRPLPHPRHVRHQQQPRVQDPQGLCRGACRLPAAGENRFEGLDVDEPAIDYVGLARSLGVAAWRVTGPDELSDAVRQSLAGDEPQLIEVAVGASVAKERAAGLIRQFG